MKYDKPKITQTTANHLKEANANNRKKCIQNVGFICGENISASMSLQKVLTRLKNKLYEGDKKNGHI